MPTVGDVRVFRARIDWCEGDQRIAVRVVNRWYTTHEEFSAAIRTITSRAPAREEQLGYIKVCVTVEVGDSAFLRTPLTLFRWGMYLNETPEDHGIAGEDWWQASEVAQPFAKGWKP